MSAEYVEGKGVIISTLVVPVVTGLLFEQIS